MEVQQFLNVLAILVLAGLFFSLILFRLFARRILAAKVLIVMLFTAIFVGILLTGGISAPGISLLMVVPVLSALMLGARSGLLWAVLVVGLWFAMLVANRAGFDLLYISPTDFYQITRTFLHELKLKG